MLSGLKFIPRDQLHTKDADKPTSAKDKKKSSSKSKKHKKRKKTYSTSSDSEIEKRGRGKKNSKRIKEWQLSDASSSCSSESEERYSGAGTNVDEKNRSSQKTKSRRKVESSYESSDEETGNIEKTFERRKEFLSRETIAPSGRKLKKKDDSNSQDESCIRAEMGLEWMLKPSTASQITSSSQLDNLQENHFEELKRSDSRELNPYLRDNGSGYPEDSAELEPNTNRLPASSVVGDGGLSWRLKALKRAREQAARDGRKLKEVVEERWGSIGQLAIPVASGAAAPAYSHIRAIKERRNGRTDSSTHVADNKNDLSVDENQIYRQDYLRDVSSRHSEMKKPRDLGSYSLRKRASHCVNAKDSQIIREAMTGINKYANDGSFMDKINKKQEENSEAARIEIKNKEKKVDGFSSKCIEDSSDMKNISANQLAAKALQLRMKGKHEEAELLMKEMESMKHDAVENARTPEIRRNMSRCAKMAPSSRQNLKEDDTDMHLARSIVQNAQYSLSRQADDEYDYDGVPAPKKNKHVVKGKKVLEQDSTGKSGIATRILTQQERCRFCFENPARPKHLVVSIANFTYLMLPQWEAIVEGHCYILPMQHESASRSVDDNVWEELRNFKKCLIKMFQEQKKEALFIETVTNLAKQQRHCLIECIPLPSDAAVEAPIYFKQAIDEAEDEWSQHNAKKLIDTSGKGLRASIPKNFPYFYVEFGLDRGFVHVIDDEANFKKDFGLNVVRGLLGLPEEDMYRRRRRGSRDFQMRAVAMFAQEWSPYDWTKDLD